MKTAIENLEYGDTFSFAPFGELFVFLGPLDTEIPSLQSSWSYVNSCDTELISKADYVYIN